MAKTKESFAKKMSELLFEMRIESDIPYGNDCDLAPEVFAMNIINDPEEIPVIKERIEESILQADLTQFWDDEKKEYSYQPDLYDHAWCVDGYIDEKYQEEKNVLETISNRFRKARRDKVIKLLLDNPFKYEEQLTTMLENYLKSKPELIDTYM